MKIKKEEDRIAKLQESERQIEKPMLFHFSPGSIVLHFVSTSGHRPAFPAGEEDEDEDDPHLSSRQIEKSLLFSILMILTFAADEKASFPPGCKFVPLCLLLI